jgi:hypothetical protein
MRDGEEASSLIGDIYDASLEPGAWSDVFAKCARFVGGMSAILLSKDKDGKRVTLHQHDGGIAPRFRRLYSDTYARLDPLTVGHYFAEIDKPTTIFDLIPRHEFLRTRFYKEWVRPQRVADFVGATVEKSTSGATTFGVFRHERDGPADGEARARVRMLAPHVRRAVLIAQAIDRKTAEASTFADTLDGMSAGMFLIDQRGSIVHANASGRAMLSQGSVLRMTDGKLTAVESDAARTIDEAVATARNGDAALGVKGVAIPLGSDAGERHVAHVLPLTSGARRRAGSCASAA